MAQFTRCSSQPQKSFCANWLQIAADHDSVVEIYLESLYANCTNSDTAVGTYSKLTNVKSSCKQRSEDLFEDMLSQPDEDDQPEQETIRCRMSMTPVLSEMKQFWDSRVPMKDPVSFWKVSRQPRLKTCTQIMIFNVPVSSAGIERL
jgi:midasin (ATPase involved in ribosome maturation)